MPSEKQVLNQVRLIEDDDKFEKNLSETQERRFADPGFLASANDYGEETGFRAFFEKFFSRTKNSHPQESERPTTLSPGEPRPGQMASGAAFLPRSPVPICSSRRLSAVIGREMERKNHWRPAGHCSPVANDSQRWPVS